MITIFFNSKTTQRNKINRDRYVAIADEAEYSVVLAYLPCHQGSKPFVAVDPQNKMKTGDQSRNKLIRFGDPN